MAIMKDSKSTLDKIKEVLGNKLSKESINNLLAIIGDASRKPPTTPPSIYKDVTITMENAHRDLLQAYFRNQLGIAVKSRERHNDAVQTPEATEQLSQSAIMGNPLLDSQRFDGIDPNVNPAPPLNSEARQEFDNLRREQEMEKQLRLGLSPGNAKRFDPKFRPSGY